MSDLDPNPSVPYSGTAPNYTFPVISVEGILSSREYFLSKEKNDGDRIKELATIPTESIYPRLVEWASHGFEPSFVVWSITIVPPNYCSDGVVRTFEEYIDFVTGEGGCTSIVTQLQNRFKDITITSSYEDNNIRIHITKVA